MNLQVCVPYQKCPFNCPMCIAKGRNTYPNLYELNYDDYMQELTDTIKTLDIRDVVLTGATDPTLNRKWLTYIQEEIKIPCPTVNIELQTKNYNLKGYNLSRIDVLSYSITDYKSYLKAWNFRKINKTNRLVILLTKEFDHMKAEDFNPMGYEQITFKVLQRGADKQVNDWIFKNEMTNFSEIYKIVDRFNGTKTSVRIDTSCQESENRYFVFREDGELYKDWSSEKPL